MDNRNDLQLIEWDQIKICEKDLDLIYNFLLENETPMTPHDLMKAVVNERIRKHMLVFPQGSQELIQYRPNLSLKLSEGVIFPVENNQIGYLQSIRDGINPAIPEFKVGNFIFEDGTEREYALQIADHKLNATDYPKSAFELNTDCAYVIKQYGKKLTLKISSILDANEDLIRIAGYWFPKALLMDVNIGFLNLAEAVLEMEEGKPTETCRILQDIDYPLDSNQKLTEFSFNYAMQQDDRFDEVGPSGKILWTLKLLEPADVRIVPLTLKYYPLPDEVQAVDQINLPFPMIQDELDPFNLNEPDTASDTVTICINYPHWKAGTLPLIGDLLSIFPTALETNNIVFNFADELNGTFFDGWVILSHHYVCGLKTWFREKGIIPGSKIKISRRENPNEVGIALIPPRSTKDWIRTAVIDAKNKMSFIVRQQTITCDFDDRLCIHVENSPQLDVVWEQNNRADANLKRLLEYVLRDLAKENPQGIVHFNEIYAAFNMLHRTPPAQLLYLILLHANIDELDNDYFKLKEHTENV